MFARRPNNRVLNHSHLKANTFSAIGANKAALVAAAKTPWIPSHLSPIPLHHPGTASVALTASTTNDTDDNLRITHSLLRTTLFASHYYRDGKLISSTAPYRFVIDSELPKVKGWWKVNGRNGNLQQSFPCLGHKSLHHSVPRSLCQHRIATRTLQND